MSINVPEICSPSDVWVSKHGGDTAEQAQLRACLISILEGMTPIEQIRVGGQLIDFMRDEAMSATATVRKLAAVEARDGLGMRQADIARESKQSTTTIARLLVRGVKKNDELAQTS